MKGATLLVVVALAACVASASASSYISGSIALDKQTLASLTPARKVDFVLGLANATQLPSSQIAVVGAEETIQEFLRVRFTIQSTDPAVITRMSAPAADLGGNLNYIFIWVGFNNVRFLEAAIVSAAGSSDQVEGWLGGITGVVLAVVLIHRLGLSKMPKWSDGAPANEGPRDTSLDNIEGVQQVTA